MENKLYSLRGGFKRARKRRGFKQTDLAQEMGVSLKTVMNWEQGQSVPEFETLMQLAETLDCDLDYLTGKLNESTHDIHFIREYTGLSEDAIRKLYDLNRDGHPLDALSDVITHDNSVRLLRTILLATDEDEIAWLDLDQMPRELLSSYANKPIDFSTGIGSEVADFLASQELTGIVRDIREEQKKQRSTDSWQQRVGQQYNVYRAKIDRSRILEELEQEAIDLGSNIEFLHNTDEFEIAEADIAKRQQKLDTVQNLMNRIRIASFAEWKRGDLVKEYEELLGKD